MFPILSQEIQYFNSFVRTNFHGRKLKEEDKWKIKSIDTFFDHNEELEVEK